MYDAYCATLAEIRVFLKSSRHLKFKASSKQETYSWIQKVLRTFCYRTLGKEDKGIIKRYLSKMSGYSKAQTARLISQYVQKGHIEIRQYQRYRFETRYTPGDVSLLANCDKLHDFVNGAALKKILVRMAQVYKQVEYENISKISVAHIYNLRKQTSYKRLAGNYQKTKGRNVSIGVRAKPNPEGKPGYIRVDSVHQGDETDGIKGVYHINMVDEIVQWEAVGAVEHISEVYMVPLLERLLDFFPYVIVEFHADNGSEYINKLVAQLLNRLVIKLSKSRSRKSGDNALVEGKNGSIIRKWLGYGFIDQKYADMINGFYFGVFNQYLCFHRPCAFATHKLIGKYGKIRKVYKACDYMTPFEKLTSIANWQKYLKPSVGAESLYAIYMSKTDNQIAKEVQEKRRILFQKINRY